ncbi:hypothetical protein RJ640_005884 [Escallonia rubra]|uniref:RCC1-like domain-containing protein n=1 Tax=Escallonia rubra TaxID=112253 RepID=A0AA88QHU9_9ASTE|nr:hypothetical protein RJ640_005884 [Escallonia rubra]
MLRLLKKNSNGPLRGGLVGLSRRWMSTVMSFGDGSHGALGLPTSLVGMGSDSYEPTPIPGLPSDVSSVTAGHYHSLAVTSRGQVWAWGRNNEAQLGRGLLSTRDTWNEPKRVEGLNQVSVRTAFASGVISMAIGVDGSLWVWGKSKRGQLGLGEGITEAVLPSRVELLAGEDIVKASLGWGHALALSKDGKLFGWGYSADGRLGKTSGTLEPSPLDSIAAISTPEQTPSSMMEAAEKFVLEGIEKEKHMPIIWEPCLVDELWGVEIVDIACGLDHSLVLCRDGTLLSSGSNIYGQLGRSSQDLGLLPVDISFRPISVASGLGHCLAICQIPSSGDAPSIVSWGWNQSSQLGREGPENLPSVVEGLVGEEPISVSGGRVHSIALTSKRELWAWGCGRNGRLGLGSSADEAEPTFVEFLEGTEVLQAVSGFDHNLVLTA